MRASRPRNKPACPHIPPALRRGFALYDYHDRAKRGIPNALTVEFKDGRSLPDVAVGCPIGHRRQRTEGFPPLEANCRTNPARQPSKKQQDSILAVSLDQARLEAVPVHEYVDLYVI